MGQRISQAAHAVAQTPDRVLDWLGRMPTTQIRVLITCGAVIATTVRYVVTPEHCTGGVCVPGWEPSLEWLGFLAAMAGIDTAHFLGKRKTSMEYVQATQNGHSKEEK